MSVEFFNTPCRESSRDNEIFGICDDQDGSKAYTDIENRDNWIATVSNKNRKEIVFTAIDNCLDIHKLETKDQESTCDGMLTFTDNIFLVELKKQRTGGWLSDAINQLKNTVRLIAEHHDIQEFKYKKAYACNRRHPRFKPIENELSKRFFNETNGFIIDVNSDINIK
ncbi:MAG: hypothetical protein ACQESX_11310 [Bacteroidota bacterium]